MAYWLALDLVKAKGYRYATGFCVSPKLADQMFEGEWRFMKYGDFEYKGQRPLEIIKFDTKKFGVEDGAMAYYVDLTKPKNLNAPKL